MPARSSRSRSCTIEVRRVYSRRGSTDFSTWETLRVRGEDLRYASVRAARFWLSDLYHGIDYLSSATYQVRLRFADGSARDITDRSRTQWALGVARAEQKYNSIGACLRRGETVCV